MIMFDEGNEVSGHSVTHVPVPTPTDVRVQVRTL
jgi:hypothetical protein